MRRHIMLQNSGGRSWSVATILLSALLAAAAAPAARLERLGENQQAGGVAAVVVEGYALAHTAQLLPLDKQGHLVGEGSVDAQLAHLLFNLEAALAAAGTDCDHLVKIAFYVDGPKTAASARGILEKRFPPSLRPVMTWVNSALPHPQALIALDAVAVVPGDGPAAVVRHRVGMLSPQQTQSHVAVLPRGDAVYVSGQSQPGDLAAATAKTLEGLLKTLDHLRLDRNHVVQLKAFLQPMEQAEVVQQQVAQAFAGQPLPPLVLVQWTAASPIEIELIASAPAADLARTSPDTVTYITPPGMTASPVYSRLVQTRGGRMIYVSGLYAARPGSGEAQVCDIFATLQDTLKLAGGDLRHLVKATYYCADADASTALNKLRPEFYDPLRPPAASKAMVSGVALADRSVTMDIIAVTPP